MEPRPQFPRQPVGSRPQTQGQPPAGGPPPQQHPTQAAPEPSGYPEGVDPAAFIAPPRTQYDYSPLDLAPPGQRRRRQLIAGAIGALSVLLLGALIVFGWILLRDPGSDNDPSEQVAAVTEAAGNENAAGNPGGAASTPTTSGEPTTAATTAPAATKAAAAQPTAAAAKGPDAARLKSILPDASVLPPGFDGGTDSERNLAAVVEALGGSRTAEQNLQKWGWSGNAERAFNADPAAVEPGSVTNITISLHGFKDPASATAALPFYSDILANLGYEDVEAPAIGQHARMLVQPQEDGGVNVALYIQKGPVLYRIGGYAPGGDPSQAVIDVATAMLAN